MKAILYKPAKTAMQSGTRNTKKWTLVFETKDRKFIEPLMGWTGAKDTNKQLRMNFDTAEQALEFAKRNNIEVEVEAVKARKIVPKTYAENFSYYRIKASEG